MPRLNRKSFALLSTILLSFLVSLALVQLGAVEEIENRTWDWRAKLSLPYSAADPSIRLIEVDQTSLDQQAAEGVSWPWPRSTYVPIIRFLEKAGAKGLAFDILFTEQSSYGPADDSAFSSALDSAMPVINIAALSNSSRDLDEDRFEILAEALHNERTKQPMLSGLRSFFDEFSKKYEYNTLLMPIVLVLQKGRFFGNSSADPDSDGVMRRYTVGGTVRGVEILNSPFAFYQAVEKNAAADFDLRPFLGEDGRLVVRFKSDGRSYDPVTADAIIKSYQSLQEGKPPLVNPELYRGKWVYLGLTAPGLFDLKPTPVNKRGKAVEFLANVLDNIINRDFILKLSTGSNALLAVFLSAIISMIVFWNATLRSQSALVVLVAGLFIALEYVAAINGYWVSFTWPLFAGLTSLLVGLTLQFYIEGSQHRFIRKAFRYYVSPALIEEIVKNPDTLSLGGERKELSIFFSDIAKFSSISEKLEPSKLVSLMNSFLSEMTHIIQANKGTVDKYIGDAVVAFWNAPLSVQDHAYLAVKTALDCQKRLIDLNPSYLREYGVEIKLRIGINTAAVTVGNFGSKERFSYTMIGDGVNLASRLEGSNKAFGTYLLITKRTMDELQGRFHTRKIASVRVVGKDEVVDVYEPSPLDDMAAAARNRLYDEALQAFERREFEKSLELFTKLKDDAVSQAYILRLEKELRKGNDERWSGVWNLTEK